MNVQEAVTLFRYYQQSHHRKRTIDSYQMLVGTFEKAYGNRSLESLQPDEMYQFLEHISPREQPNQREGCAMPN